MHINLLLSHGIFSLSTLLPFTHCLFFFSFSLSLGSSVGGIGQAKQREKGISGLRYMMWPPKSMRARGLRGDSAGNNYAPGGCDNR